MHFDPGTIVLILISFFAAVVNGALGYGFSSLTVPVALLFYPNKILAPALVLVELAVNLYTLAVNRRGLRAAARRTWSIVLSLIPGIILGSYMLSSVHPGWLKFSTYIVILPLILLQAAGFRKHIHAERKVGIPLGVGIGILYSTTTISGPPLAIMFNNQGLKKEEFRAALGVVRVAETVMTAIAYYFLRLYVPGNGTIISYVAPGVLIGLPLGVRIIRSMNPETFRRVCMSFDAWVVGFGLSRAAMELKLLSSPGAYIILLAVALVDAYLLYRYFWRKNLVGWHRDKIP